MCTAKTLKLTHSRHNKHSKTDGCLRQILETIIRENPRRQFANFCSLDILTGHWFPWMERPAVPVCTELEQRRHPAAALESGGGGGGGGRMKGLMWIDENDWTERLHLCALLHTRVCEKPCLRKMQAGPAMLCSMSQFFTSAAKGLSNSSSSTA